MEKSPHHVLSLPCLHPQWSSSFLVPWHNITSTAVLKTALPLIADVPLSLSRNPGYLASLCLWRGRRKHFSCNCTQLNLKMPPRITAATAPPFIDSCLSGPAISLWEELHGINFIFFAQATFEHQNTGKSLSNWSGTLFVLGERKKLRFLPTINFPDSLSSFCVISFSLLWGRLQWKMFQLKVCCHCKTI